MNAPSLIHCLITIILMVSIAVDMSPSSSGRTSPVEQLSKSTEELWQRVEQPQTQSQPQLSSSLRHDSRPKSIHGMPTRKTFNLEEERKRLEKWQAEQERLRQEQYEHEQRRLQEQREKDLKKAEEDGMAKHHFIYNINKEETSAN